MKKSRPTTDGAKARRIVIQIVKDNPNKTKSELLELIHEARLYWGIERLNQVIKFVYNHKSPIVIDSEGQEEGPLANLARWEDPSPDRVTDYPAYNYLIEKFNRSNKIPTFGALNSGDGPQCPDL